MHSLGKYPNVNVLHLGSTLTLEELNGDGIKKEVQEKIAKSKGSMAWLHFANVPGDPTSAVCNSCQVSLTTL